MTQEMKTSEVLTKAKTLIENPENWMQGDYTDGKGCFCSLGAIAEWEVGFWKGESKAASVLLEVVSGSGLLPHDTFAVYNDRSTHAEVMEAFDKAIALSLSRGE